MKKFQRLTFNTGGAARTRKLHGREYFVAPAVMMVEGVHKGNKGRILYRRRFLKNNALGWNHKPIVNYHPKKGDEFISASDADVLDRFGMGFLLNSRYGTTPNGKKGWLTETWFDKEQTRRVDPRVYDALRKGEKTEVSTGMWLSVNEDEGEWNGERYDAEAVRSDSDHLAILPDQEGACSNAKGAGLFVNRDFAGAQRGKFAESGEALPDGSFPIVTVQDVRNCIRAFDRAKDKVRAKRHIVKRARALGRTDLLPSGWVRNSAASNSDKGDDNMPATKKGKKEKFDANAHIEGLVANRFTEEDREWLEGLDEETLQSIPLDVANEEPDDDDQDDDDDEDEEPAVNVKKKDKKTAKKANKAEKPVKKTSKKASVYNVEPDEEEDDESEEEPVVNADTKEKKVTLSELIANATPKEKKLLLKSMGINPEQIREMKLSHQRERAQLVQKIVANEANQFEEDELNAMNMDTLRKMAASMAPGRKLKDAEFGVGGDDEFGDPWEGISFMGANAAEPSGNEGAEEDRFLTAPGEGAPTVNSDDDEDDEKPRKKKSKKKVAA
jgi:hypothetical protein